MNLCLNISVLINLQMYYSETKVIMGGVQGLKDAWRLGVLHVEYERLKKKQY